MATNSLVYSFRIGLPASADRAFRWATDYSPQDLAIMGEEGRRTIEKLAPDTILLTDVVRDGRKSVTKTRLVRLLPDERMWTNTHLTGPFRHSQFLYRIVPRGRNRSRLEFTGLQILHGGRTLSARERARRALEIRDQDRATWVRIVRAMRRDLGPGR